MEYWWLGCKCVSSVGPVNDSIDGCRDPMSCNSNIYIIMYFHGKRIISDFFIRMINFQKHKIVSIEYSGLGKSEHWWLFYMLQVAQIAVAMIWDENFFVLLNCCLSCPIFSIEFDCLSSLNIVFNSFHWASILHIIDIFLSNGKKRWKR